MPLNCCCHTQMVRILHVQHESMDLSCLLSMVHADGDVMVWGIVLVPTEHCLNSTACLSVDANHVHSFITNVSPSSDGCFQHHATNFKLVS